MKKVLKGTGSSRKTANVATRRKIARKPGAESGKPSPTKGKPPSVNGKRLSAKGKPSSAKGKPSSAKGKPSSAKGKPSSVKGKPSSSKWKPASAKGKPAAARRGTETPLAAKQRMATILARLERAYPDARCSLRHETPLHLLMATILSAQCTDARVNMVTPALFARYRDAHDFAGADPLELEEMIRSTGFFHNKARNIIACARELVQRHGGEVPADLDSLVQLPGIGRKTANVVLGNAFGIPGLVVDTHVTRIANLLSLTAQQDPNKIEIDLMAVVPRDKWTDLAHLFIEHGRRVCVARRPHCAECVLNDLCPSSEV